MDSYRQKSLRGLVLAIDALLVAAAMLLSIVIRPILLPIFPFLRSSPTLSEYALVAYLAFPLMLGLSVALGLHRTFERNWTLSQLTAELIKLHVLLFLLLLVLIFVTQTIINRTIILSFLFINFGLLWTERFVVGSWLRHQFRSGQGRTRILLVGDLSAEMSAFFSNAQQQPLPPLFVGRLGARDQLQDGPLPNLGEVEHLEQILHNEAIDQVVFFPPFNRPDLVDASLRCCESLGIPANFAIVHRRARVPAQVVSLYESTFLAFAHSHKVPSAIALKHALDVVTAAVLLVALSPLFLLVSVLIWVTMGQPIFFVQERAGLYGRRFRMRKFRTMMNGAESRRSALEPVNEMSGPVFKVSEDPRVTPLGRFLRRTSLDELPQLFHVLLGAMSLVGPRPLPIDEQQAIRGWHRRRLSMKPGITGLWQVSGRNNVDFEDWMRLDLNYVDHWSLLLDLRILAKTVPAVLFSRGAR